MAVYTNDLRLTELATGEGSGTWGTTTNTNLSLIADSFGFGTEAITTNADTHTTTIADGSADAGRAIFLKYTGTLDSTCTITIGPNTVSKLWFIENATSGSQSIIIKQGSGSTVTIANGQTKAIYSDGAGSGGAMVDAFQDLSIPDLFIDDDLTVGDDLTVTGLATIGETLGVTGVLTANAGVVVDNITIDGNEIDVSSGNLSLDVASNIILDADGGTVSIGDAGTTSFSFVQGTNSEIDVPRGDLTVDVAGNIVLDADGGEFTFSDGGTAIGKLRNVSSDFRIQSLVSDKDIVFVGNDGGGDVTALTLDMSDAGTATFNHDVKLGDNGKAIFGAGSDLEIYHDGSNSRIHDAGTGVLLLQTDGTGIQMKSDGSESIADFNKNGGVNLYFDNSNKLSTTSTGIDVTGKVVSDGLDTSEDLIIRHSTTDHLQSILGTDSGGFAIEDNNAFIVWHQDIANVGTDTGLSERFRIDVSGNLGLGTSGNPAFTTGSGLEIQRAGAATLRLEDTGSSGKPFEIYSDDGEGYVLDGIGSGMPMIFKTVNAERARIDTSGNVGIGTTPSTRLHTDVTGGDNELRVATTTSGDPSISFYANGAGAHQIAFDRSDLALTFTTVGSSERMRIDASGNVGIGTNSPSSFSGDGDNLVVGTTSGNNGISIISATDGSGNLYFGDTATTSGGSRRGQLVYDHGTDSMRFATAVTERMRIDSSGNVGIAQSSPSSYNSSFDDLVVGASGATGITVVSGTGNAGTLAFADGTSGDAAYRGFIQYNHSNDGLAFGTSGVTAFNIAADGSLSTSTAGTSNVRFGVNAGNSITSGGNYNVLVGDEAGTALTTGIENTIVGARAGDALTTGQENVAIGQQALTADTKGNHSTAIGHAALFVQNFTTSTDSNNTAVGFAAGAAVTTGIQNVLLGSLAGDALTDSDRNVAIGHEALTSDTLGQYNVAVGYFALANQNFTSATNSYNTAMGYSAGGNITTATNNTLVGGLAGDALTTGDTNVAVGGAALSSEVQGDRNVAVGYAALEQQSNSSDSDIYNTAVGYFAGGVITTGFQNTLIGGLAGDSLTDSDANVAVGYAALSSDTLGQRSVAIGKSALGSQNFTSATNSYNIAIGYEAGKSLTTALQNTLVGALAGDAITTGNNNVSLGYFSLTTNQTGAQNVAIGVQALSSSTGNNNTAVGMNAGLSVTSGVQNVLLGALAGDALGDADNNVAIGYGALGADTVGSGSVAIGQGALESQNFTSATNTHNTAVGHEAGKSVSTGTQNTLLGDSTGDAITSGVNNTLVGRNVDCASDAANAIGLGHSITATSDHFSFGKASNVVSNNFTANASFSRSSDERWKKEISSNADCGLNFIKALRTVTYKWKAPSELDASLSEHDSSKTSADYTNKMYGFIAQEVKQAMDDNNITDFAGWAMDETSADNKQGISYEMFVVPLIKAVQEQQELIESLTARIATLEG